MLRHVWKCHNKLLLTTKKRHNTLINYNRQRPLQLYCRQKPSSKNMKTEHILIIRFSAIGDVAMTVPVVYSLAHQYPHLRINVLSRPYARCFFENLAPNVGFMAADIDYEYHGVTGLNNLYRRLIAKQFTAIADFHNVLRSNYLRMRFSLANYKVAHIDKHRDGKRALTRRDGKVLKQQPSQFHNYAEVLEKLGYPVRINFTSIFPITGGNLRLLGENYSEKKKFEKWIGVAPFAAHPGKIYPTEKMEKVVALLIKKHPSCRIFLFGGGKEENALMNSWAEKYPQVTNASFELASLEKEMILMSHLNVMISMDSANMHLAAICNTPVVSVWGATHPYAGFMGWNQRYDDTVQTDLPCRPCSIYGNRPCYRGDFACMNNITPETIVKHAEVYLQ